MQYKNFTEFYPYYLSEHSNVVCRRLHFIGSLLVITILVSAIISGTLEWLILMPVAGYGFAWIGHFFFENNKPATFKHPLYSLIGDWVMFWQILRGELSIKK